MRLPDLNNYPSVLEFDQIDEIYENVLDEIDNTERFGDTNKLVTFFIDVIHSQGYRPDESLRKDLARRVLKYLESWWDESNVGLCENITILSANLDIPDALSFLEEKKKSTKDLRIKKEIIDTIKEILKANSGNFGKRLPLSQEVVIKMNNVDRSEDESFSLSYTWLILIAVVVVALSVIYSWWILASFAAIFVALVVLVVYNTKRYEKRSKRSKEEIE